MSDIRSVEDYETQANKLRMMVDAYSVLADDCTQTTLREIAGRINGCAKALAAALADLATRLESKRAYHGSNIWTALGKFHSQSVSLNDYNTSLLDCTELLNVGYYVKTACEVLSRAGVETTAITDKGSDS